MLVTEGSLPRCAGNDTTRGALGGRVKDPVPAWPPALDLEQVVACIADDARGGIETLRRAIRGGKIAATTRAA